MLLPVVILLGALVVIGRAAVSNPPTQPTPPSLQFLGDAWATGKWGRADASGVFRKLRRDSGINCVRFAVQARYVKPTPGASVADGFDLAGPKFWAATHSPETTYRDILCECSDEGYEPVVTLLTSEELRPTGLGELPAHLGKAVGRYGVPVPKTLAELTAWEAFCREAAEHIEGEWPGLVRRFEIWNGFQHCGTPAAYALIVRHAANGVREAVDDAIVLANPAGTAPVHEAERWRRMAHVLAHCGDSVEGLVCQCPSGPAAGIAGLAREARGLASELTGCEDVEVWNVRWDLRAQASFAPDARADAVARLAQQTLRHLSADHTGVLCAGLFGLPSTRAALVNLAAEVDRPGAISDVVWETSPVYQLWRELSRCRVASLEAP